MRVVEGVVTVLMNPEDATAYADGMFSGYPIVADPATPPGYALYRVEPPADVDLAPPKLLRISADERR